MNKRNVVNLVDISGFIYRAFYAFPKLKFNDTELGAVYGFSKLMLRLKRQFPSSMFVAAFDSSKKTFRNKIYSEYKSHRKSMPDELVPQLPLIERASYHLGFTISKHMGYEADDIIASYVKLVKGQAIVNVISSDKDLTQLLDANSSVNVYDPFLQKFVTNDDVQKKFGVSDPKQVLDILTLSGDSSDNIPGVPGIGPKTASLIVNEFGTIENLLNNLDKLPNSKKYSNIRAHVSDINISYMLAKLHDNLDVTFEYSESKNNNILEFFNELGFKSLITRC